RGNRPVASRSKSSRSWGTFGLSLRRRASSMAPPRCLYPRLACLAELRRLTHVALAFWRRNFLAGLLVARTDIGQRDGSAQPRRIGRGCDTRDGFAVELKLHARRQRLGGR